jgi:N-acetylglucosamine kinase-like BadF-type ATPase
MLLIADSGSTKTDWILVDVRSKERKTFKTAGFNPMVQSPEFIDQEIGRATELLENAAFVTDIRFFGAGCSSSERISLMVNIISRHFPEATIVVEHDMDGAVIATCGDDPGFACILGTGSNAVLFNGNSIVPPKGSLGNGYILGDEGSGAFMGRYLLRDFLYENMPEEIIDHFRNHYHLDRNVVLDHVYRKPNANTYMASFSPVLTLFRDTDYIQQLLHFSFTEFFRFNICRFNQFEKYPAHFIGSIAVHFEKELKETAAEMKVNTGKIIAHPAEEIVQYFINKA